MVSDFPKNQNIQKNRKLLQKTIEIGAFVFWSNRDQ